MKYPTRGLNSGIVFVDDDPFVATEGLKEDLPQIFDNLFASRAIQIKTNSKNNVTPEEWQSTVLNADWLSSVHTTNDPVASMDMLYSFTAPRSENIANALDVIRVISANNTIICNTYLEHFAAVEKLANTYMSQFASVKDSESAESILAEARDARSMLRTDFSKVSSTVSCDYAMTGTADGGIQVVKLSTTRPRAKIISALSKDDCVFIANTMVGLNTKTPDDIYSDYYTTSITVSDEWKVALANVANLTSTNVETLQDTFGIEGTGYVIDGPYTSFINHVTTDAATLINLSIRDGAEVATEGLFDGFGNTPSKTVDVSKVTNGTELKNTVLNRSWWNGLTVSGKPVKDKELLASFTIPGAKGEVSIFDSIDAFVKVNTALTEDFKKYIDSVNAVAKKHMRVFKSVKGSEAAEKAFNDAKEDRESLMLMLSRDVLSVQFNCNGKLMQRGVGQVSYEAVSSRPSASAIKALTVDDCIKAAELINDAYLNHPEDVYADSIGNMVADSNEWNSAALNLENYHDTVDSQELQQIFGIRSCVGVVANSYNIAIAKQLKDLTTLINSQLRGSKGVAKEDLEIVEAELAAMDEQQNDTSLPEPTLGTDNVMSALPELVEGIKSFDTSELDGQAAEMLIEDNEAQDDNELTGKMVDDLERSADTVKQLSAIAKESLADGGLSPTAAVALTRSLNIVRSTWGMSTVRVGLENFNYEDSRTIATEEIIKATVDTLTALVRSMASAAGHLTDTLTQTVKRMIIRGDKIQAAATKLLEDFEKHADGFTGVEVKVDANLNRLRINGELNPDRCSKLAVSELDISKVADQWRGIWAKRKDGVIYSSDMQEESSDFLKAITTPAAASVIKAMPGSIGNAAPFNVLALPGDVFVVNAKDEDGIVKTGWTDGKLTGTDEVLPALDIATAKQYAKAAYTLGDMLTRELGDVIRVADSVHQATIELERAKLDDTVDKKAMKQANENVKAAYQLQNALVRAVWNSAEGLLTYAEKSITSSRNASNQANKVTGSDLNEIW